MKFHFEFTDQSFKQFNKLPPELRKRIVTKLSLWESQSDPLAFAKPIPEFNNASHRFRIGKHRIIVFLEKSKNNLVIVKIGPRDKVYK